MQNNQRKIANILRDFLDKAILPEVRRNNSLSASCQYFISILSQDPIDLVGLQAIVETFPTNRTNTHDKEDSKPQPPSSFAKRKEDTPGSQELLSEQPGGFNPSRTFGGERSRYNMFPSRKPEAPTDSTQNTVTQPKPQSASTQPSKALANMQNIYRVFMQNQVKLQQIIQQSSLPVPTNTRSPPTPEIKQYY